MSLGQQALDLYPQIRKKQKVFYLRKGRKDLCGKKRQNDFHVKYERKCKPFLFALEHFPNLVKEFIGRVKELAEKEKPNSKIKHRDSRSR